ncbi:MAG: beta-propeller fold lactonase family protein, partial [Candidatus Sulfotelmatobacter sp.]
MKPTWQILPGVAAFLIFALSVLCAEAAPASHKKYFVYVGTYTAEAGSTSKGIYAYRFDSGTGELTSIGLAAETANPSFLAVHPNHRFLYAVNET